MMYRNACLPIEIQSVLVPASSDAAIWHSLKTWDRRRRIVPLWLMLCKDLPLGVIADDLDVDKTS